MKIPIFPLGLVLFPGENLKLHIFEPRYKQLVNDCVAEGTGFGIPPYINGSVMETGTEAELLAIERIYHNGEMDVIVRGSRIFVIHQIFSSFNGKLYAGAEVTWHHNDMTSDIALSEKVVTLATEFCRLLHIPERKIPSPDKLVSFHIAHIMGLSLEQEYALLCMDKETDRLRFLSDHLNEILPFARQAEALRDRIKSNGHFTSRQMPDL